MVEISVIMSEYNTNPDYLREAIESVLNQSFKNFEFIIVDDGGKNDLKKIIKEYNDDRIILLENEKNMGNPYSSNRAILKARGKYIVRMDTDDVCYPDRFKKQYEFIKSHDYDVVAGQAMDFNEKGNIGVYGYPGELTKKRHMRSKFIFHSSVIMKKEAILKIGMYKSCDRALDFLLWTELLLADYKIFVMDDVLIKYRINDASYIKRRLSNRKDELRFKIKYYPKLGANFIDYLFIVKVIISGLCPIKILIFYNNLKCKKDF